MMGFGILILVLFRETESANTASSILFTIMMFFAGIYFNGVYRLTKGGDSWVEFNEGMHTSAEPKVLTLTDTCLYTGIDGFGIWKSPVSLMVGSDELTEDPVINIFPNPSQDYVYIETNIQIEGLSLKILDYTGKVVFELHSIIQNRIQINTTKFTPGVYIVCLESKGWYYSDKLIIY
jgi:hypothetical protein